MAQKQSYSNIPGSALSQVPYLREPTKSHLPLEKSRRPTTAQVAVRPPGEIPSVLLDYFKINPKNRKPLTQAEKNLYAQVFLHEIEEGTRILEKHAMTQDAAVLRDFSNEMHLAQRLEQLRQRVEETLKGIQPERVHKTHKIRHNQWGSLKTRLGHHPVVAWTETGVAYKNRNEDAFIVLPEAKTIAVADGMGGNFGGDVASGMAIDFFEYAIEQGLPIEEAINYANEALLIRSQSDSRLGGMNPMGCTFSAVQLKNSILKIAHIGDTKVFVIRKGKLVFATEDHTKGQELLKEGIVDELTAFELNHILNRCLGMDKLQVQRDITLTKIQLERGDRIVLSSDGITDNFFDTRFRLDSLVNLIECNNLTTAADRIAETCHRFMASRTLPCGRAPKPDNLTLAILEYRG